MNTLDSLEIVPAGAALGAEVRGVYLTLPVSDSVGQALRDAWYEHLVLLFRRQDLSDDAMRYRSPIDPSRRRVMHRIQIAGEPVVAPWA